MKRIDGRKISTQEQQQNRYIAIELRKRGKGCVETAKILGVNPSSVSRWYKIYEEEGIKALVIKRRGANPGSKSKLNPNRMNVLKEVLIKYTPDDLELGFSLWTRQAIQNLLSKIWRVKVHITTVGRYMRKLGFTPQKPVKRAYEQNPKTVKKWLSKEYPKIAKQAEKEEAEIHWLDETKLSSYSNYLRGYAPKGKTPLLKMKAKRMNLHIISSISKLGKMRFMTYQDSLNTEILIKFIKRLSKVVDKRIFLIMDNLAVHHSKKFMHWLENYKRKIKVFYLPPYSPELNPDERLNRDLKTHFHSGSVVRNAKELKNKIVSFLLKVQKKPKRIKNYFNSYHVRYAA